MYLSKKTKIKEINFQNVVHGWPLERMNGMNYIEKRNTSSSSFWEGITKRSDQIYHFASIFHPISRIEYRITKIWI